MKSYSYSFDEFVRHCTDWGIVRNYEHVTIGGVTGEVGIERDYVSSALRVRDYMEQLYGTTAEAAEKAKLFSLMQMFLDEHAADFDFDTLAVVGREQGLISHYLLRAVHHIFTRQPLPALGRNRAPQEVIALAKKYASQDHDN